MTYQEALDYIYGASAFGKKPDLANMRELLARLNHPEDAFRVVHVAGTNGKGSTACYIAAMLAQDGARVGLYTSPYLMRFNDRIRVDGEPVTDGEIAAACEEVRAAAGDLFLKVFELTTAIGLLCFRRRGVDIAVVEAGIGGRHDATNVLSPALTVVTAIGLDHTHVLGETLERISWEKAGIAKPGVTMVLYPQAEPMRGVFRHVCSEAEAPLVDLAEAELLPISSDLNGQRFSVAWEGESYPDLFTPMLGRYQMKNAMTAVVAAHLLGVSRGAVYEGLRRAVWPGRMERIRREPLILLDGAHNPQAVAALTESLGALLPGKVEMLVGIVRDKDAGTMVRQLAPLAATVYTVSPDPRRGIPPEELAAKFRALGVPAQPLALTRAWLLNRTAPLVVAGSLYLAGQARSLLLGEGEPLS